VQKYWVFAAIALLAAVAIAAGFSGLELNDAGLTLFGQVLGTLLMLSAVLERGLDVLLSIPLAEDSEKHRTAVAERQGIFDKAQETAQQQDTTIPQDVIDALERAKAARALFRARTMRVAMVAGLVLGIVVSAIGFRVLRTLIDPTTLAADSVQLWVFDFVDIVLTGAVLAGGSDGIHKLIEVYRRFTAEKQ